MVTIQKYVKAQSLEEAWKLNQGKKNRRYAVDASWKWYYKYSD